MTHPIHFIVFLIGLTNVLLHAIGVILMHKVYSKTMEKPQQIYFINLAVTEALRNLLSILMPPASFILFPHGASTKHHTSTTQDNSSYVAFNYMFYSINPPINKTTHQSLHFQTIVGIFIEVGCNLSFSLSMIFITLDRLMLIVLNMKYPVFWNQQKAKRLVAVTWVLVTILTCGVIAHRHVTGSTLIHVIMMYFNLVFDGVFTILSLFVYTYIFCKFVDAKKRRPSERKGYNFAHPKKSLWTIFRNSKFFLSLLLIATFLIFSVQADLWNFFVRISGRNRKVRHIVQDYTVFLYVLSDTSDAIILIFIQRPIRRLIHKKLFPSKRTSNLALPMSTSTASLQSSTSYMFLRYMTNTKTV